MKRVLPGAGRKKKGKERFQPETLPGPVGGPEYNPLGIIQSKTRKRGKSEGTESQTENIGQSRGEKPHLRGEESSQTELHRGNNRDPIERTKKHEVEN